MRLETAGQASGGGGVAVDVFQEPFFWVLRGNCDSCIFLEVPSACAMMCWEFSEWLASYKSKYCLMAEVHFIDIVFVYSWCYSCNRRCTCFVQIFFITISGRLNKLFLLAKCSFYLHSNWWVFQIVTRSCLNDVFFLNLLIRTRGTSGKPCFSGGKSTKTSSPMKCFRSSLGRWLCVKRFSQRKALGGW